MKRRTHYQASFHLPEQIIQDTTLSPSAKQLAMVLYSLMPQTGTVSVSQRRLAGLSGLALSTVNQALPQLKKRGYLSVMNRARLNKEKGRYQGRKTTNANNFSSRHLNSVINYPHSKSMPIFS